MNKQTLKAMMSFMIVLSTIMALLPAVAFATTNSVTVRFEPTGNTEYIVPDCVPPLAFDVEIVIDSDDLFGWAHDDAILFNKDVLQCTGIALGPLAPSGASLIKVIDNTNGEIRGLAVATTDPSGAVSGNDVALVISFECIATGSSTIDFTEFKIKDTALGTEIFAATDLTFQCQAYIGPPMAPVASFTPATCNQYRLDKDTMQVTVDFDASASTGSYDSLPEGGETSNPIIEYAWDFNGDSVADQVSSNYVVALSVTDIENYYDAAADYFMGWNCKVEWDPAKMTFVGYEEGPLTAGFDSVVVGVESPAGVLLSFAMGALEEVSVGDLTGSGIIAYLYFSNLTPECAGTTETVTVSEEIIASYNYENGGERQIFEEAATFVPSYAYQTPNPLASYTYTEVDDAVDVTLTIYAPDCNDTETHVDFVVTASVTNTIHILPPIQGADIDVYTERGGEGKGCDKLTGEEYDPTGEPPVWSAMSDAFGPQEAVTVCANVTYNNEPVANKLVGFEIRDGEGNIIATRTETTNDDGVACVTFRIPWQGSAAEDLFGPWLITASVDVSEITVIDKCRFRFGYLVSIIEITVDPTTVAKLSSTSVTLDLANIAFSSKDVVITITMYDEASVPIATLAMPMSVPAVGTTSTPASMDIPSWAFVGVGTVYANVFDDTPANGGTAMCPEASTSFIIEPAA